MEMIIVICSCDSKECNGKVNRYKIYSPSKNTTYPNRFWGISDYCETHQKKDKDQGFILLIANEEPKTFVL